MRPFNNLLRNHFCQQLTKPPTNSIQPVDDNIAFGYYFPKQWSEPYIYSLLDPRKTKILEIQKLKSKMGQFNGKIMFRFADPETMRRYVLKYNEDYITTKDSVQKVVLKPFELRTEIVKREKQGYNTKNCVRIQNLSFQITEVEIKKLAMDYGEVEHIELEMRTNGLNRGDCKVYFKKRESVGKFIIFIDGLEYEERKLKANFVEKKVTNFRKQIEKQFLEMPKKVFAANRELAIRESARKKDYVDSL